MQHTKKHSTNLITKKAGKPFPKRKCSFTQTENDPACKECCCNVSQLNAKEFKFKYMKALRFLNNCHETVNKMLIDNFRECGDSIPKDLFLMPKIPNCYGVCKQFLQDAQSTRDLLGTTNDPNPTYSCSTRISDNTDSTRGSSRSENIPDVTIDSTNKQTNPSLNQNGCKEVPSNMENNTSAKSSETFILMKSKNAPTHQQCPNLLQNRKRILQIFQKQVHEELKQILPNRVSSDMEFTDIKITDIPPEKLNLLEYSMRNVPKDPSVVFESCLPKYKRASVGSFDFKGATKQSKSLNGLQKALSPKKVNLLFDRISQENLADRPVAQDSVDSAILKGVRFEPSDHDNKCRTRYSFPNLLDKSMWESECDVKSRPTISHPLQLSKKDRSLVDENVLRTMGLYTKNGNLRPEVIEILQDAERLRILNDSRSKPFRSKRKLDVEIHFQQDLNADNTSSLSLISFDSRCNRVPSISSISSDIRSDSELEVKFDDKLINVDKTLSI